MVVLDPFLDKTLGKFVIQERIGSGGVAVVYKAIDGDTQQPVALKILHPTMEADIDTARRFRREAEMTSQLHHPHIVRVRGYGQADGHSYLVMDYMKGGSLARRFYQPSRIKTETTLKIIHHIASALDYAHARKIVHRDIKLENILLYEKGAALSDFGIARILGEASLTLTGNVVGTPLYIAPEQARGSKEADYRVDLYSFGIVAYLMLVGCFPFNGNDVLAIMSQHVNEPVPVPHLVNPEISHTLSAILMKMLSKNPADRYESAGDFAKAIEHGLSNNPISQTLVDLRRFHTPADGLPTIEQLAPSELRYSADEWYQMAQQTDDVEEKISYLKNVLKVAPLHTAANRDLFRLEGAKPREVVAPTIPKPLDTTERDAPIDVDQIQRQLQKPAYLKRQEKQRVWNRVGCISFLILSMACSFLTLRLIGFADQVMPSVKSVLGGPTPIAAIEGTPIASVTNPAEKAPAEKVSEIALTGTEEQTMAVDVLDAGYAHEYTFQAISTIEFAVYVQFVSADARNVPPNVAVLDEAGIRAAGCAFSDSQITTDRTSVTITCIPQSSGKWKVRIFGKDGESTGFYFIGLSVFAQP
jgi:serine/threonine protein kinase